MKGIGAACSEKEGERTKRKAHSQPYLSFVTGVARENEKERGGR